MPTFEDCTELQSFTDLEEITINEIKALKLTSKVNGVSLIFPESGGFYENSDMYDKMIETRRNEIEKFKKEVYEIENLDKGFITLCKYNK